MSFLSAVAIRAVEKQEGKLLFPKVDPNYLRWLERNGSNYPPQQGCIPNRFKGGVAKVSGDFDPRRIEKSIEEAWHGLAEDVWEHDLQTCSPETQQIWNRQVDDFWEMAWGYYGF